MKAYVWLHQYLQPWCTAEYHLQKSDNYLHELQEEKQVYQYKLWTVLDQEQSPAGHHTGGLFDRIVIHLLPHTVPCFQGKIQAKTMQCPQLHSQKNHLE